MGYERTVLGLDIGVGSVGWGLVRLTEEQYQDELSGDERFRICGGEIIASGVRTFQLPQDRDGKSLAVKRGTARRNRLRTRRKKQRLKKLVRLGQEFGLIDGSFNQESILKPQPGDKEEQWDIWWVRKEALNRKLTDIELFRILYHIAKHRGFYFHTMAEQFQEEETGSEAGKAKAGLARIREKLEKGNWDTVGQMFWEEFNQQNEKNRRKRNKKDDYQNAIHRLLLKEEIQTIFDRQQKKFNNTKVGPELMERYIDEILMYEEGIDDEKLQRMMSRCEFTAEKCAPKEGYVSERFSLFNRLNSLELIDTANKDKHISLKSEQRDKIVALAYKNSKVTFSQIRTELELKDQLSLRFNLCSYREKDPEYSKKLECKVQGGKLVFEDKHCVPIVNIYTGEVTILDGEIKKVFQSKELWPDAKKLSIYYSDIRKQLQLSDEFRFKNLSGYTKSVDEFGSEEKYIKQFESNDTFVELKGFHKIRKAVSEHCGDAVWKELRQDDKKLETIAEALTYCKSDETRTAHLHKHGLENNAIIEAVLTLNMSKVASFSSTAMKRLLEYMEHGDLFKDAKEKSGYGKLQYDKQAILQPYSGFFEKNPVVARVFSQTRKVVNAIIRKYGKSHPIDQIHIEIATELAKGEKERNRIKAGQNRYREAKKAAEKRCIEAGLDPDEGQTLLMFRLAEEQGRRCPYTNKFISTDSKVTTDSAVYILDCEIDHVIPMSRSFNDSLKNKILCTQKANQDKRDRIPFEWFEDEYGQDSQQWADLEHRIKKMYDMPYAKKRNLLRKSWTDKDKENFISRNLNDTRYAAREVANYLRKYFDFSGSGRDDIKDAKRIQLRSGGVTAFLRHIWGLNKDRKANDLHHALDALVVACSTDGHVYLVSNLSRDMERKGKGWFRHFDFLREKFKPWGTVREDIQNTISDIFVSRMPRHTVTGAGHEDTVRPLVESPKNRVTRINQGFANMGPMVRADIYMDKNGKNYVVPLYAVDFAANKPLPDKYVHKSDAPYDEWPSVKGDGLGFKFSVTVHSF
ncbi:MAG: type II CRISPR RNA-guided endonuclease Cas9 [Phycisphaerae bacterium]|nr:type II CRISPR RNA-guided endonuclease Cas9 [Phycisphaerae bacterium]